MNESLNEDYNKIKNNNFICIFGWMRTKYNLNGNDLLIYAIIHGFSQDGKSVFSGGLDYICQWVGCSRQTAITSLKKLIERKLIVKNESKSPYCVYWSTESRVSKNLTTQENSIHQNKEKHLMSKNLTTQENSIHQNKEKHLMSKNLTTQENSQNFGQECQNFGQECQNFRLNNINNIYKKKSSEEEVKNMIKKLFNDNSCFQTNFYKEILSFADENSIRLPDIFSYLNFCYELTKKQKPTSFANYYHTIVLSNTTLSNYKLGMENDKKVDAYCTCPICENPEVLRNRVCDCCGFDTIDISDMTKIKIEKQVYKLPPDIKQQYLEDMNKEYDFRSHLSFNKLLDPNFKKTIDEKITAIYQKYGITV